jgi:hypothetical protein
MQASLKHLLFDPEPRTLAADPAAFSSSARLLVGPADGPGEESFNLTICSPEWLAVRCREQGIVDARHHLVVNADEFDQPRLQSWLESRVREAHGGSWSEIGESWGRLGHWEFEDYRG